MNERPWAFDSLPCSVDDSGGGLWFCYGRKGVSIADQDTLFVIYIEHDDGIRDTSVKTLEAAGPWQVVQVVDIAGAVDQLEVMSPSIALLERIKQPSIS